MQKLVLLIMFFAIISVFPVFGQEASSGQNIIINTDNTAYSDGDVITLTGSVNKVVEGLDMSIQIFSEVDGKTNLVEIAQVIVTEDGQFTKTFVARGSQWQNEGIPVSRHYRQFAEKRNFSETYCLFIAPTLHPDTVEIFYIENRKRSEDKRTKTIPFTISQFIEILELLIKLKQKNPKTQLIHEKLLKLYEKIILSSTDSDDEIEWRDSVQPSLDSWKEEILANS